MKRLNLEVVVDSVRLGSKVNEVTRDLIDFCIDNNLKIDLKTCEITGDTISKGRYNRKLIEDLFHIVESGNGYPADIYKVFKVSSPQEITHTVLNKQYLPKLKISEIYADRVREKTKSTMKERYGVEHNWAKGPLRDKLEDKWEQIYSVRNPLLNKDVKDRAKSTMKERYGVENFTESESFRDRAKSTMKERYGVEHNWAKGPLRDKLEDKWEAKYGVRNPLGSKEIQRYAKHTILRRYGSQHPMKSPEISLKCTRSRNYTWGERLADFRKIQSSGDSNALSNFIVESYQGSRRNALLKSNNLKNEIRYVTEYKMKMILDGLGLICVRNARKVHGVRNADGNYIELDFWLPKYNLGIEVNGLYIHSVNTGRGVTKTQHFDKFMRFREAGINVLTFTDFELFKETDFVERVIKHCTGLEESSFTKNVTNSLNYGMIPKDLKVDTESVKLSPIFIGDYEYWDCGALIE